MLFARTHGNDEARVALDDGGDFRGTHLLQAARRRAIHGRLSHFERAIGRSGGTRAADGTRHRARWLRAWWAVAAALALLATSQWLHAPSVEYLVSLIVATVAAAVATAFVGRSQRWWALASVVSLAGAATLAIPAQRTLLGVQHRWEDWRRDAARRGLDELKRALDAELSSSSAGRSGRPGGAHGRPVRCLRRARRRSRARARDQASCSSRPTPRLPGLERFALPSIRRTTARRSSPPLFIWRCRSRRVRVTGRRSV
jgi:hypothetical protein